MPPLRTFTLVQFTNNTALILPPEIMSYGLPSTARCLGAILALLLLFFLIHPLPTFVCGCCKVNVPAYCLVHLRGLYILPSEELHGCLLHGLQGVLDRLECINHSF